MNDKPGRQQLSGYVMRDYEHTITTLGALGCDLAIIPKEGA